LFDDAHNNLTNFELTNRQSNIPPQNADCLDRLRPVSTIGNKTFDLSTLAKQEEAQNSQSHLTYNYHHFS